MPNQSLPPPIFVLAAPGMPGQTVAAALGLNPAAYGVPELNLALMPTIGGLQSELTGLRSPQIHGLLRALAQILAGEQTMLAVETARRWLIRRAHLPTGEVARELAARIAPRRMVEPVTAALFDRTGFRRLRAAFPEARFVHLQMHPHVYGRMMAGSPTGQAALHLTGAMDETTSPATPDPQELWLMAEAALAGLLADLPPDRVLHQKVEDLAADPMASLAALASALDLPTDDWAVSRMARPETSVFAGPGPMGAHIRSSIQSFGEFAAALPESDGARLTGPLPWRPDGVGFRPEVRQRAEMLGYR